MLERMENLWKFTVLLLMSVIMGGCVLFLVYLAYCTAHTLFFDDSVAYTFRIHQIKGQATAALLGIFASVFVAVMIDR